MNKNRIDQASDKPNEIFDRDWEWAQLTRFARSGGDHPSLGLVWGRRRQGKTLLVQSLAEVCGGRYLTAVRGPARTQLADMAREVSAWLDLPGTTHFDGWRDAFGALFRVPGVVVVDEFPELATGDTSIASIVQDLLGPRSRSATRLVLCGSAQRFMRDLLSGSAPLRGRAGLELVVRPFDLPTARAFWDIDDEETAFRVWATLGGTPAYGREFVAGDRPVGAGDFDRWMVDTVLNPAVPLLREASSLLYEEAGIVDTGLYQAVLAAVAAGERTSSRIGGRLGRPASAVAHPLAVLCDVGYLIRDDDLLHGRRSAYRIAEPLLRFHHALVRPNWARLQRPGRAALVWAASDAAFRSAVLGPAFEEACRWYVEERCADWFPGEVVTVGRGTVADPASRVTAEIDIVVLGEQRQVLLVGEAKWSADLGSSERSRLEAVVARLAQRGFDVTRCRYLLASARGRIEPSATDETVDLPALYREIP